MPSWTDIGIAIGLIIFVIYLALMVNDAETKDGYRDDPSEVEG